MLGNDLFRDKQSAKIVEIFFAAVLLKWLDILRVFCLLVVFIFVISDTFVWTGNCHHYTTETILFASIEVQDEVA